MHAAKKGEKSENNQTRGVVGGILEINPTIQNKYVTEREGKMYVHTFKLYRNIHNENS